MLTASWHEVLRAMWLASQSFANQLKLYKTWLSVVF